MITAIAIENFKGIRERVRLQLKPILALAAS
jgi:AAA15 family ATPase/GTPase